MYENGKKQKININLPTFKFFKPRKPKFNKKTLFMIISKFGIICLFFFIFVFCFSRFGKIINKEYDETEFNTNITYIEHEVLNYYKNGDLPEKKGDISAFSLEELINMKIVNKNKINDINNCDIKNSYVNLLKSRDKLFTIKIYLKCNDVIEEQEHKIKI